MVLGLFPKVHSRLWKTPRRAFLLKFSIFRKKANSNTLFIDYKTAKSKGLKEVINSLLTFVENLGKKSNLFCSHHSKKFFIKQKYF